MQYVSLFLYIYYWNDGDYPHEKLHLFVIPPVSFHGWSIICIINTEGNMIPKIPAVLLFLLELQIQKTFVSFYRKIS